MNSAGALIPLLFTYGPFALLVFFLYVAESKARTAMQSGTDGSRRALLTLYIATWVAIFGLLIFSSYAWYELDLSKPRYIAGSFIDLIKDENIFFNDREEIYLRRTDNRGDGSFSYEWHWYPRENASSIPFTFSRGKEVESSNIHYAIPVDDIFYTNQAQPQIRYDREQDKIYIEYSKGGKEQKAELRPINSLPKHASLLDRFLTVVHAQGRFSEQQRTTRLESENPDVRAAARSDLAAQGVGALPYIQKILLDRSSGPHSRYGALWALNAMNGVNLSKLSPDTLRVIRSLGDDFRPEVKAEAQKAIATLDGTPPSGVTPPNRCAVVTLKERTWRRVSVAGDRNVTLAMGNLYRIYRGPEETAVYLIASDSIYGPGSSGKFDTDTAKPPADQTAVFRFSKSKFKSAAPFPAFKAEGRAYRLRVTGVSNDCIGNGCQFATFEVCSVE